tara:strand:+ start:5188 stop:5463 length:276 start_codon:yes stop_codon:yes gene_type:complete
MAGKTMKYYKSAKGKKSYKKKLKKDVERSTSKKGLKKRAELKRLRRILNAPKGKDVSHTKNGVTLKSPSKNRGSKNDTPGDKRARGRKYKK